MNTDRVIELSLKSGMGQRVTAFLSIDCIAFICDGVEVDEAATAAAQKAEMEAAMKEERNPNPIKQVLRKHGANIHAIGDSSKALIVDETPEEIFAKIKYVDKASYACCDCDAEGVERGLQFAAMFIGLNGKERAEVLQSGNCDLIYQTLRTEFDITANPIGKAK